MFVVELYRLVLMLEVATFRRVTIALLALWLPHGRKISLFRARFVTGSKRRANSASQSRSTWSIALNGQEQKPRLAEYVEKNPDLIVTATAQLPDLEQGRSYRIENVEPGGLLRLEAGHTLDPQKNSRRFDVGTLRQIEIAQGDQLLIRMNKTASDAPNSLKFRAEHSFDPEIESSALTSIVSWECLGMPLRRSKVSGSDLEREPRKRLDPRFLDALARTG
jgi:hypothetical protein